MYIFFKLNRSVPIQLTLSRKLLLSGTHPSLKWDTSLRFPLSRSIR